jgi:hypothetical protein
MCSWAFTDAASQPLQSTILRLIPSQSSEALGSPAPLRYAGKHFCISHATLCVSME